MPLATLDQQKLRILLRDDDAFATSLLAVCLDKYGTDVFEWDPKTLRLSVEEDFGVDLPPINGDKLQSLILVYTTDLPYVSVEAFNHVCNVLSGSEANFRMWDVLSPEEAIWGMYEMSLNVAIDLGPSERPPEYSHEVRRYLGVILKNDGIFEPPDILRIAEMEDSDKDIEQWADDPVMFNAAFDKQRTEKARLLEFVGTRLLELLQELNGLPLHDRDAESWNKFYRAASDSARRMAVERRDAVMART